jgi:hypothetical protein
MDCVSHVAPTCAPNRLQPAIFGERSLAIDRAQARGARIVTVDGNLAEVADAPAIVAGGSG